MKKRTWLSALLAVALLVSMLVVPSASAAGNTAFTDITDPDQANAAEMLRLLFHPLGQRLYQPGRLHHGGRLRRRRWRELHGGYPPHHGRGRRFLPA